MRRQIPEVVVSRLPMYLRVLALLKAEGIDFVSSRGLGSHLKMTPAQIRKDLCYFGKFGRQGRGYNVSRLYKELKQILGLDKQWSMALVGVGRLGRAIMDYKGFIPEGFKLVAAFEKDRNLIGKKIGGVMIEDIENLEKLVKENKVDIAIVAVPSSVAQTVIDKLAQSGIKAILNYAPICARVPRGVRIQGIDPVVALQSMTFYMTRV
ncbi:MAG TPA: redox-sensing transcriptional repressor Rex [Dehalococcoidia bacterium]|nr:redox-sensing transcriptional repressor Rex [Dehalococcoidia bacterium]